MSWETIELSKCVSILSGFAFKSKLFNDKGKGLPIIRIRDVTRGYSETFYEGEHKEKYLIQDGDYLIGMDGEFNISSWQGGTALLNQRVCKIDKINEKILDRSYLAYFLSSELEKIEDITPFVTVKHLSVKTLNAIKIPLPPLGEQRRIAAVLDKADQLRQKRRAALAKLDTLLQATFLHMFGDPVTNPMGWEKRPLGDLTKIRRGASPRPISKFVGGTVPWIKIGDATHGSNIYIYETAEKITEAGAEKSVFLNPGALIVANSGVSLGFARILKISGCVHDGWLALDKIHHSINKIFLLKLINHLTLYFRQMAPSGTQPNLNTTIMKEFEVIVPPIELQEMFVNSVNQIEKQISLLAQSGNNLDNLFHALQQRAFNGQL